MSGPILGAIVLALGFVLGAYGVHQLLRARGESRYGTLVAVDSGTSGIPLLRSERWRISGRPDEIRATRDGRWIPVEWKTRGAPRRGPPDSHRLQVLAYCLLCEEARGAPPPYGIVRYGDGREFQIAWDEHGRLALARVRDAMAERYDGSATPAPWKCAGCRWREACDARSG